MTIFTSQGNPQAGPTPDGMTYVEFLLDLERPKPLDKPEIPEYPVLIEEATGREVFMDELRLRTDHLSRALRKNWSLGSDDIVALCFPNHLDYPVCIWAGHRLGCIVTLMNATLTTNEMVHQLNIAKPSVFIVHSENLSTALEASATVGLERSRIVVVDGPQEFVSLAKLIRDGATLPPILRFTLKSGEGKNKIAVLIFSSGTTGLPKAVALSHFNLISHILQSTAFIRALDPCTSWDKRRIRAGDVMSGVLPLHHIYGLADNLSCAIYWRNPVIISPKFQFETFLRSIAKYRIAILELVPPIAILMCKHPAAQNADYSSVRVVLVGGAAVEAELVKQFTQRVPNVHFCPAYGQSETTAGISTSPVSQVIGAPGSAGRLLSGITAKIVKEDGSLAKPGEPGELWVQSGGNAIGYYRNEKATKETFVDGWVCTGDLVTIESNGDLFIHDRIKEILKVKGEQVAPAELEDALLSLDVVAEAGVIGVPDNYSGEVPRAYVVLTPEAQAAAKASLSKAAELRSIISLHIANTKSRVKWLAGGVVFVESLPKAASGKILRRLLREKARKDKDAELKLEAKL